MSMPNKFRAFVGGFGSGKTWVGCMAQAEHYWKYPGINQGYFAPTYPQIRDIYYPTIEEVAFDYGLRVEIKTGDKEVNFYRGIDYKGTTLCRSMDNPGTIVGFKIGNALVDEFDLLETKKAELAWRKIIGRMRYNIPNLKNGIDVTTTPEGFRATYNFFVKDILKTPTKANNYGLIQASTEDNAHNLPEDYISSLYEAYPPELIRAYINGEFVNLTSGTVYSEFDRTLNHSDETIKPGDALHVGMDFNVNNMSAVVHVYRGGLPVAVDEIAGAKDTPRIVTLIKDRYQGHKITIYPDASGRSASSANASVSDISLLRDAGFFVSAPKANPRVRERVVSMNAMLCNANGDRRYKINTSKCPEYTLSLEQQAYDKNGVPDKANGHDHMPDAAGYFINRQHPAKGLPKVSVR